MKETVESLGRVRLQGILLLVITFVVGAMAGMMLDRANPMRDRKPRFERMDRRPDDLGEFPGFFEKLDLTEEQRNQIHKIFEVHRPVIDSLMAETMPRIRAARDSAEAAINDVLTPDQRERFEKLQPRHRFPMGPWGRPFDSSDGSGRMRRGPGPR